MGPGDRALQNLHEFRRAPSIHRLAPQHAVSSRTFTPGVEPEYGTFDRVEFVEIQDGVFQIVAATQDVQALKGIVPKPEKPVTIEEMNQAIAEMGGAD